MIHSSRTLFQWLLVLCGACGGHPKVPEAALHPASQSAPAPARTETAPAAPASAPYALSHASEPAAPTFHVVNEVAEVLSFLKLGDTTIVTGPAIFSKLTDLGIERSDLASKGLSMGPFAPVTAIAGTWPEPAWATMVQSNGRVGWGELYRRGKSGWSRVGGPLPETRVYVGLSSWSDNRILALQTSFMGFGPKPFSRFQIIAGTRGPVPELTPTTRRNEACAHWGTELIPEQFVALPSGHVYVLGRACDDTGPALEFWEPGQKRGRIAALPPSEGWVTPLKLLARSPKDVYAFFEAEKQQVLGHFDGSTFTRESLPVPGIVSDADLAPDGTILVITRSLDPQSHRDQPKRLWWRPPGGAWAELSVPQRKAPERYSEAQSGVNAVAARSQDDIWVSDGDALLHTRPRPGGPLKIEWESGQQFPSTELRIPRAATPSCKDVFVLLYAISRTTPDNYDFPLTREALKGHAEFRDVVFAETEDNGRRFFGAFVKDYRQGSRLSKLIRERVAGSIPAVLCAKPNQVREIPIDLATGKVRRTDSPAPK